VAGPLDGYITSTTAVTGNSDLNNRNHGYVTGTLGVTGFVASTVVTLTAGDEPDDAGRSNYSIDFGFLRLDYGDLPDSSVVQASGHATHTYPTQNADDGARHVILPENNPTLGDRVDAEANGQPETPALGDDNNDTTSGIGVPPGDGDEDGVSFPNGRQLIPGEVLTLTVRTLATSSNGADGRLTAWIDLNGNGVLETAERIVAGRYITAGETITLGVAIPLTVAQGITTYARFRLSSVTETVTLPTGLALAGEVEDYALPIVALDYGDLPDSSVVQASGYADVYTYPTQNADDGARHIILPENNPTLGDRVDAEANGQPETPALGDDNTQSTLGNGTLPGDDEDGVRFPNGRQLIPGEVLTLTVRTLATSSNGADGRLTAWIDLNGNGVLETAERIVAGRYITAGETITLGVAIPLTVAQGITTYARFRLSSVTETVTLPTGLALAGEVEDYALPIVALDYGDLPDSVSSGGVYSYPTQNADDGARHIIVVGNNPTLGDFVDAEADGQPSANADEDDLVTSTLAFGDAGGRTDDEDGITFDTLLIAGQRATITVRTLATIYGGTDGSLNGWIDFDGNGALDAGERIVTNRVITAGDTVQISFVVPVDAITGNLYSRFRYSTDTGNSGNPSGLAADGEVEDYLVRVEAADLGDLPDGLYPTTYGNNGAAHIIDGTRLGAKVDAELDGQSSITAGLDDVVTSSIQSVGGVGDDEDGVQFLTPVMPGRSAQIQVTAGTTGLLEQLVRL
jgi:hypothetical protein